MTKYLKSKSFLLFLLIPFFKPICFQYFTNMLFVDDVFVIWKIISAVFIVLMLFIHVWNKGRISGIIVWTFLFEFSIVFSTLLYKGDISRALIDAVSIIAFVSILSMSVEFNCVGLLQVLSRLLNFLMVINLLSMIICPNGLPADLYGNKYNSLYFMVIDNGSALFLLMCMFVFMLESLVVNKKVTRSTICAIIVCLFSALLSFSATTIVAVFLLLLFYILIFKSNLIKTVNPIAFVVIYIGVLLYLMTGQESSISSILMDLLFNRTSDFTGRYTLWKHAISMIKQQPLLGYGRLAHDYLQTWGGYYSSHNALLEIMLQGGLVALVGYLVVLGSSIRHMYMRRRTIISNCIFYCFWVMMVSVLMESIIHSVYIFGVVALGYCCMQLNKEAEGNNSGIANYKRANYSNQKKSNYKKNEREIFY